MTKELWLNLPVRDVQQSKNFFTAIGFSLNAEHFDNQEMACLQVGEKKSNVLLFAEHIFKSFVKKDLTDTQKSAELCISFDAESREEIDDTARKVFEAGGKISSPPAENQGWMYGFAFNDLDGHQWNQLYMDLSKKPPEK